MGSIEMQPVGPLAFAPYAAFHASTAVHNAAMKLGGLGSPYVTMEDGRIVKFRWNEFKTELEARGLFLDQIQEFDIHQDASTTYHKAAAVILAGIERNMNMRYTHLDTLRTAISTIFECLKRGDLTNGTREYTGNKVDYTVTYATPHASNPEVFYAMFTTIKLTAHIKESVGWLWNSREGNFTASVTGIRVAARASQFPEAPVANTQ